MFGRQQRSADGMTLVEVMVSTGVVLISVLAILFSYVKCVEMNNISYGAGIAMRAVKDKVEEIKSANFSQIVGTYNNAAFNVTGLNGKGVVYATTVSTHLVQVKVVYCWALNGNYLVNGVVKRRTIGEDTNLNGRLDTGEDRNGNGQLDSYIQIITQVYG
jgi:Tfp pilus assembly protein PilV